MNLIKYTILLSLSLSLFIPSIQGSIINPSFEEGSTGWNLIAQTSIVDTVSHDGTYSLYGHPGVGAPASAQQLVTWGGINNISFWYKSTLGFANFRFYYDYAGNRYYTLPHQSNWTYIEYDMSFWPNTDYLRFYMDTASSASYYIDEIKVNGEGWVEPSSIMFIPDVDTTNSSIPPSLDYFFNDTDWPVNASPINPHLYIYRYYLMDNDEWSTYNYLVYNRHLISPEDTIYLLSNDFPLTPEGYSYKFKAELRLYNSLETVYTPVTSDTLIYDPIDYEYIPPTPVPSPIPTPVPSPIPTITPLPTLTPTPVPTPSPNDTGILNTTINKTGMQGFYNGVNGSVEAFNNSLNGAFDFLYSPLYGFTDYINTVNDTFTNNTNQSTGHKTILQEIMIPFFIYFPQKMINLISYYLTLCLILLVLRE